MSECVVRMEMPKSCEECPLVQTYENDWGDVMSRTCNLIYKGYLSDVPKGERRDDCPIICALPENHGRLVDMKDIDSMMEDIQTTSDESGLYGLYYRDDFDFDGLPTIVPATEGGKE